MEFVFFGLVGLLIILGLVGFVCFVMVCMKMFQNDQTGLGIACLATYFLCGGVGGLIAFVYGWMKAGEWRIKGVMTAWTGVFVLTLLLFPIVMIISMTMVGTTASMTFQSVGQTLGGRPR
ncbi:hypothetical protein AYO40_02670 [Planctomycetaceae bacterium SCGC AG-212-D15]|nr:hypothetical protein AYO40_02670 [Planctomycetaceae bacterium SCGC AG-212-D15]